MPRTVPDLAPVEIKDTGVVPDGEGGFSRSVTVTEGKVTVDIYACRAPMLEHSQWHFIPEVSGDRSHEGRCRVGGCHEDELRRLARVFLLAIEHITEGLEVPREEKR